MPTIQTFCRRHCLLLAGVLVAALSALLIGWAGYDLSSRVDNEPVYTIVNDTYSQTIELGGGLSQQMPVSAGQTLYGVRLDLTTYNHAFAGGTLTATLHNAAGQALATAQLPCIEILDNTFAALIFDTPYTPAQNETLTLRLTAEGFTGEDTAYALGLWVSEAVVSPVEASGLTGAMPLFAADGTACGATAAIQYVTDYSGHWSVLLSAVLGVLTFASVVGGFALLGRRGALWAVVLLCGGLLGLAFAVLTPPLVGPDEYTHLAVSYERASKLLGQPVTNGEAVN